MRFAHVEDVARALLYEGHVLYPYRRSAHKNQRRFPFGVLCPRAFADAVGGAERWRLRLECLVAGSDQAPVRLELRFLHPTERDGPTDEAAEVRFPLGPWPTAQLRDVPVRRPGRREAGEDDRGRRFAAIDYSVSVEATRLERELHLVTVEVRNETEVDLPEAARRGRPDAATRDALISRSLSSVHVFVGVEDGLGELISLLEPPEPLAAHAEACRNEGVFPVLVGPLGRRDTMLASPVLVYDYPRLAPESPGDFFDGTEIDELLALRVLTLTDAEKDEVRRSGGAAAQLLARTEALGEGELAALHGRLSERPPREVPSRGGAPLVVGDCVRIEPRGRADAMDIALAGRAATVASIEQDVDGSLLVSVTVDDDPGRDLGLRGWPGHRFFFRPDELERLR